MDVQFTQITQRDEINTKDLLVDENNNIPNKMIKVDSKISRKRKSRNSKGRKNNEKRKHLKCVYCDTSLNSKYSFCPECGNEILKDLADEEIEQLKKKYQELEKKNEELEKKLIEYQEQQEMNTQQIDEQEKMKDLMWIVAAIPKPQFNNEKIKMSDFIIRKISPAFTEFLGFQEPKQLINSKMSQILPTEPSQSFNSQNQIDFIHSLASKEESSSSFLKDQVFRTLYDELYLSNLQFNLYGSDSQSSLCIIVLTSLIKITCMESLLTSPLNNSTQFDQLQSERF